MEEGKDNGELEKRIKRESGWCGGQCLEIDPTETK